MSLPVYLPPTFNRRPVSLERALVGTYDWGDRAMEVPALHAMGILGKGIRVAIIDTGKSHHPDLKYADAYCVIPGDDGYDRGGHGSHVASIVRRIAPEAELISIKALGDNGSGDTAGIAKAIRYCTKLKVHIINLSLGGGKDPIMRDAVNDFVAGGGIIIWAAGNSGSLINDWPAGLDNVAASGSFNLRGEISKYSSHGPVIDFAAPGEQVLGCDTKSGYVVMDGTSMAAPGGSGMAALLMSRQPVKNQAAFMERIKKHSTDRGPKGFDNWFGWGQFTKAFVLDGIEDKPDAPGRVVRSVEYGQFRLNSPARGGEIFGLERIKA